jgi:hypothetical protein
MALFQQGRPGNLACDVGLGLPVLRLVCHAYGQAGNRCRSIIETCWYRYRDADNEALLRFATFVLP